MRPGRGRATLRRTPAGTPAPTPFPMSEPQPTSRDHLETARELVWDAVQTLEEAQRVLFRAGDCYVKEVWGDGVRSVIEMTERITALSGDLGMVPMEIDRLSRRDRDRPLPSPW